LEQLEILLLLSSSPEQARTVEEIYAQIRSNQQSIARRLQQLVAQGLVRVANESAPSYRYAPATPEMAEAVQELAVVYKEHRVGVIEHIFSEPPSPIQGFADAFRLRKDEPNG
jgi:predicted transcriptional regulator